MRRVIILGATGSIGTTALDYIRKHRDQFSVEGIVANTSRDRLVSLSEEFSCRYLLMTEHNESALDSFLLDIDSDIVLNGIAGSKGLYATVKSLESGKDVALANKESVVMGGQLISELAKKLGRRIIPVDSEHSAIYHLLVHRNIRKLIITASGGPFIDRKNTEGITLSDALRHPTWKMGRKISIDSATLANKGLEVIEASHLFGFGADDIDVVVHRQSVVHSMVYAEDGAIYAAMSPPDMTHPIITALSDDHIHLSDVVQPLDFSNMTLTFEKPDMDQFPLLALAYMALRKGGSYPIAYNAADEVAVNAFIEGTIPFSRIPSVVSSVMESDFSIEPHQYEEIMQIDHKARILASEALNCIS